ncbi:FMI2 protein [Dothidotthia symphoricarpi CBS 119687]|uniref:FMI2 protein n=1 Tax=Dothidotthia symphoricarpi CBS 119687 TaxID=1392245 RepID=A0A6A6A9M5_9PLEO|nr:FMI2 protein [Dothidotthia symphoricarpi CBS 119687]KAF2127548.1 FMI2 protein [Dothidotthia symphoricarpi CBS 119687]
MNFIASPHKESAMSDSPDTVHRRNHNEYSYRLPTPPRIVVPPPTLTTEMPGLALGNASAEEVDMSFLKDMNLENIVQTNTLLDWAYERRRQAQMILPWLYLGPMVSVKDKAFLAREGITMALAIRAQENTLKGALLAANEVCAEVRTIESSTFHALVGRFAETTRMINSHVARARQYSIEKTGQPTLGKVLVFCESGNEKSAAVVAAYLMDTLSNFNHVKAMQVCQAQRFCVNFDDTLKNILRSHWDIIQAKRSVATSNAQSLQTSSTLNGNASHLQPSQSLSRKRSIETTCDDEDMDMGDGMDSSDALRFSGRDVTPFQDMS